MTDDSDFMSAPSEHVASRRIFYGPHGVAVPTCLVDINDR